MEQRMKSILMIFSLVLAAFVSAFTPAQARQDLSKLTSCPPASFWEIPTGDDVYVIAEGDNLSYLAWYNRNDQAKWRELQEENPKFMAEWRQGFTAAGKTKVVICPGEPIVGLKKIGIPFPGARRPKPSSSSSPVARRRLPVLRCRRGSSSAFSWP